MDCETVSNKKNFQFYLILLHSAFHDLPDLVPVPGEGEALHHGNREDHDKSSIEPGTPHGVAVDCEDVQLYSSTG